MSDSFDFPAPLIKTGALKLRGLAIDDATGIYAYASDPEVARYTLWPQHKSEEFIRGLLKVLTAPTVLGWAIILEEKNEIIGMIFLHSLIKHHKKAEIAFNLARIHWGRGHATDAARAVICFAFDRLSLNRIEATCMPGNLGSRRVLEKLGMSYEGKMRKSHFRYDGFHDMDLFSLLHNETGGLTRCHTLTGKPTTSAPASPNVSGT